MNKKIILLIIMAISSIVIFSGPASQVQGLTEQPDAEHSYVTDEHGCWPNPLENSWGHYREEDGIWIRYRDL